MMEIESQSEYKNRRKQMLSLLKKTVKKAKTKVAERTLKSQEREESPVCSIARQVFHESLEMYESGEMEWKDMVEDLYKTLLAVETKSDSYKEEE